MFNFYFAKEKANYLPIPSEEPVINTHESYPYLFTRFFLFLIVRLYTKYKNW